MLSPEVRTGLHLQRLGQGEMEDTSREKGDSVPLSREKETELTSSLFWRSTEWKVPHIEGLYSHLGERARQGLSLSFPPPGANLTVFDLWKLVEGR